MEIAVIAITVIYFVREYVNYKERQNLLDRVMSKNYTEFKDIETPEENIYEEDKDESVVGLEEAREEIDGEEEN